MKNGGTNKMKIIMIEGIPYIDITGCVIDKSDKVISNKTATFTDIQRFKEKEHIKGVLRELKEKFKNK